MKELVELETKLEELKSKDFKNSQCRNKYNVTIDDLARAEILLGKAIAKIMNGRV